MFRVGAKRYKPRGTEGTGAAGLTLRGCHTRKQRGQHRRTCVLEPFQNCLALRGPGSRGSCSLAFARAVRACPYFCLHLPRCDLVCRRLGGWPLASASASHKDAVSQQRHITTGPYPPGSRPCSCILGIVGVEVQSKLEGAREWLRVEENGVVAAGSVGWSLGGSTAQDPRRERPRRTSATRIDECA